MALDALTAAALCVDGLTLEPLQVEHAAEITVVLDDTRLHTFTGGSPAIEAELRRTYERQVRGGSEAAHRPG